MNVPWVTREDGQRFQWWRSLTLWIPAQFAAVKGNKCSSSRQIYLVQNLWCDQNKPWLCTYDHLRKLAETCSWSFYLPENTDSLMTNKLISFLKMLEAKFNLFWSFWLETSQTWHGLSGSEHYWLPSTKRQWYWGGEKSAPSPKDNTQASYRRLSAAVWQEIQKYPHAVVCHVFVQSCPIQINQWILGCWDNENEIVLFSYTERLN